MAQTISARLSVVGVNVWVMTARDSRARSVSAESRALEFPGPPWLPLEDKGRGYLSVYYSEPLARWPVRHITRPGDNKSDPNIETGTYGLFSTCEPSMRNRIVADGAATIFFLTTHRPKQRAAPRGGAATARSGRVLTGYYHVAWCTEGTLGAHNKDFALAADEIKFIDPVPVVDLPASLAEVASTAIRTMKPLDAETTSNLRRFCGSRDDRTPAYLEEVSRIEQFSTFHSGFSYPSWGREHGFSWDDAEVYYRRGEGQEAAGAAKNRRWCCSECSHIIHNAALLRRCPVCGEVATLKPHRETS